MSALVPEDVGLTARFELSPSTMVFAAAMLTAVMLWKMPKRKKR